MPNFRVLTARDLKIALSRYVYDRFGETITAFKFHPDLIRWLVKEPNRFPSPAMRALNLGVTQDGNGVPVGYTVEEVFGVSTNEMPLDETTAEV